MTLLLLVGIAGHAFSIATAWLLPVVSEYSLLRDNISELAIGHHGYVQTAAFLAVGAGSLALAVTIRRATNGSWGSLTGSVLSAATASVRSSLRSSPPTESIARRNLQSLSAVSTIHIAAASLAFVGVTLGMFVLTRTFKRDPRWQTHLARVAGAGVRRTHLAVPAGRGAVGRVVPALLTGTATIWLMLIAFRLRAATVRRASGHPVRKARH